MGGVYNNADFTKRGLPENHDIMQELRPDGQEVMYWRETSSGWVLGFALAWNGENFEEYLYAALARRPAWRRRAQLGGALYGRRPRLDLVGPVL